MPKGIIVFGANGCGKSTLSRELAEILHYRYMDIEDYFFEKSEIPYSKPRTREECQRLLLADMEKYGSFILSAVKGDFGEEITSMYECGIYMSAPLNIRLERVKKRSYRQFGERMREGGDMYEREKEFFDFVAGRSLEPVEKWAESLTCPVLELDAVRPVAENVEKAVRWYQSIVLGIG